MSGHPAVNWGQLLSDKRRYIDLRLPRAFLFAGGQLKTNPEGGLLIAVRLDLVL